MDWLLADNIPTGLPNYVGVGVMAGLAMLAAFLFLFPIVTALHTGEWSSGYQTEVNHVTGKVVHTRLSDCVIGVCTAPFFGLFVGLAVACHKGNLDQYASLEAEPVSDSDRD